MGFLDKAKQAAEQAQKKLEETQSNFNKGQADKAQQQGAGQGAGVQYDKHGRPIQPDAPPAAAAPSGEPPAGAPSVAPPPAGSPTPEPPPPAAGPAVGEPGTVPPPPEPAEPQQDEPLKEGINQNPDPFRPIE